jgi:hypothetical protein
MKEQVVVNYIEAQLKAKARYYINVHGSTYSQNGTPDFITQDKDGVFVGIEAKAPKKTPVINQWRHAIKILNSGGRFIVGQEDFDINKMDDGKLPKVAIGNELGESEFEAKKIKITKTSEVILKK